MKDFAAFGAKEVKSAATEERDREEEQSKSM